MTSIWRLEGPPEQQLRRVSVPWPEVAQRTARQAGQWLEQLLDYQPDGHEARVATLALSLAYEAQLVSSPRQVHQAVLAGLLHDIGKSVLSRALLDKAGPLTADEMAIVRQHPVMGHRLAVSAPGIDAEVLGAVLYHHEQWGGEGYPAGLIGHTIPVLARVITVVDVYDALVSDRPYRAAWSSDEALAYLEQQAGRHFDPSLVDIFVRRVAPQFLHELPY